MDEMRKRGRRGGVGDNFLKKPADGVMNCVKMGDIRKETADYADWEGI